MKNESNLTGSGNRVIETFRDKWRQRWPQTVMLKQDHKKYWIFCVCVYKEWFSGKSQTALPQIKDRQEKIRHPTARCHAVPPSRRAVNMLCGYFQSSITSDDSKTNSKKGRNGGRKKERVESSNEKNLFLYSLFLFTLMPWMLTFPA